MDIQCESCQARYILDERLFKDARAVRVKCRKCGGYTVVKSPEAPVAPPPVAPPPVAPPPVVAREAEGTSMPPMDAESEAPDMAVIMAKLEEMLDNLPARPLPTSPPVAELTAPTMPPMPLLTAEPPASPMPPPTAETVVTPPPKRNPLRSVPPPKEEWTVLALPAVRPPPPPSPSARTPASPVSPPSATAGETEAKPSAGGTSFLGNLVLLPSETNVPPSPKPPPAPPLDPVRASRILPTYNVSRGVRLDPETLVENRCVAFFPDAPELDPYRVLRTRILQAAEKKGGNTVMITSALPREGKTVTAINLALTFSKTYLQTAMLVDCDLRQQRVREVLGFESGLGLGDYLTDGCPVSDMIVWPGVEKLTLISGGKTVSESSELLGSPAMKALVEDMKNRYPNRYVFFDVPPVLAGADALGFAPLVDHILFVVRADVTPLPEVQKALEMLPKEKVIGLVLNRQKYL